MKPSFIPRVAVIGCGSHSSKEHGPSLAQYCRELPGRIDLTATCDQSLEKAEAYCQQFGFGVAYTDMERMLDEVRPDACLCIVPVAGIVPLSSRLLRAGVPCVIEKPPGTSRSECQALAHVASTTGTPHMVSVNRRFQPHLHQALTWARAHGAVRYVRASMLRVGRREPDFLWSTGIHLIDAVRHIAGNVTSHRMEVVRNQTGGSWYALTLRFAGGCVGQLQLLPTAGRHDEVYEISGDDYTASVAFDVTSKQASLRCWHERMLVVRDDFAADIPLHVISGTYHETQVFLNALHGECEMFPRMSDVLPSMTLCFDLAESEQAVAEESP